MSTQEDETDGVKSGKDSCSSDCDHISFRHSVRLTYLFVHVSTLASIQSRFFYHSSHQSSLVKYNSHCFSFLLCKLLQVKRRSSSLCCNFIESFDLYIYLGKPKKKLKGTEYTGVRTPWAPQVTSKDDCSSFEIFVEIRHISFLKTKSLF